MECLAYLLTLMAGFCSPFAMAEPVVPRLSASVVADGFLSAFNGGQRSTYEAYLRDHWPSFKPTDEYADMRAQTGGYDVVEKTSATDTLLLEVVKARSADDYLTLKVEVGAGPGHPISQLAFTPTDRPTSIPPPERVGSTQVGRLVDRQLRTIGDFSGAVLIAQDGRPVYRRAAGLADREHSIRNTPRTRFGIASMGKMFTAVAILQLNQVGRLDLDATVGSLLPDYPNAAFAHQVTIRQLLTHTAGAGDFMSQLWADNYTKLKTPADYIALFGRRPPEFKPGSRFSYANYGFIVLGRIVEVVSGESYENYLRDHIFQPTGMTSSGLNGPPVEPSDLAVRYVRTSKGFDPPPPPFLGAATPAGDAYTTVGDLLAFSGALEGHRLLDPAHTEQLLSPKVKSDSGQYAFGFEVRSVDGISDVGHDGGGPGENGTLRIINNGRAVIVVLSNVAPTWRADQLGRFIAARLRVE